MGSLKRSEIRDEGADLRACSPQQGDVYADNILKSWESQDRMSHAYLQMNTVTGSHYVVLKISYDDSSMSITDAVSLGKFLAQLEGLVE